MSAPLDLFARAGGGGSFPKVEDLEGKLVLLKPTLVEDVPKNPAFGGKPGETVRRASADTVIFAEDGTFEEYDDMYWSQTVVVKACERALKPGALPYVLGRVGKVPSSIGKNQAGKYDSREKIEAGLAEWLKKGGKGEKPNFAWGLDDFTDEDKATASAYIARKSPIASAAAE